MSALGRMKKSRTRLLGGEALASPSTATVQLPLPLLDVLTDARTAFFGLRVEAGQQVLLRMMEADRTALCGPPHVPDAARRAYRHGQTRGEVTLGGRRLLMPRLRARSIDGAELVLPSVAYAARRDPLDAHTLATMAAGVATRAYAGALDPLPLGRRARAIAKSSVSRRFVARTQAQLTAWLAQPLDTLDVRVVLIDGLHFRDHIVLLALGMPRSASVTPAGRAWVAGPGMGHAVPMSMIDYGPLAPLIGTWNGDKGRDVAPEPDGAEENPYFETITFTPIGDVANAER